MLIKEMPSYRALLERIGHGGAVETLVHDAFLHVLRTGVTLQQNADKELSRHGISQGRFMILALLATAGEPMTMGALADMASVTTATVSTVVTGMVRDGLVERLNDRSDRRVVRVRMREAGRRILDETLPLMFQRVGNAMAGLTRAELDALIGLLQKVRP